MLLYQDMRQFIHNIFTTYHIFITMGIVCLVVIIVGYGEYRRFDLQKQVTEGFASTTAIFTAQIKGLDDKIASIVEQNNLLSNTVQEQITQSSVLADQLGQVSDTAETLDKLSKVDPQLLQKYSKVFFLNENYEPAELTTIPKQYVYNQKTSFEVLSGIFSHLEDMFKDAAADGVDLKVISAYRSFDKQATLKSTYQVIYGAGTANQFSADQGYSEHQLGTTIDITTPELKENFDTFDTTESYTWLIKNAYKYGFILSYPKNNAYYVYEPWHWRFVGVDLANRLHRRGNNFYDLDQRTINNYLSLFFD